MTTLDVPCDGRASFRRLNVRALHEALQADETRRPSHAPEMGAPCVCEEIIATYLRPIAYLARPIGT